MHNNKVLQNAYKLHKYSIVETYKKAEDGESPLLPQEIRMYTANYQENGALISPKNKFERTSSSGYAPNDKMLLRTAMDVMH